MIAARGRHIEELAADFIVKREQRQYSTRTSTENVQIPVGFDGRRSDRPGHTRRRFDVRIVAEQLSHPQEPVDERPNAASDSERTDGDRRVEEIGRAHV